MKEFMLLILSIILFVLFGTIGFVFELIDNLFNINKLLYKLAICIDQAGNVICGGLFNHILIKNAGYKFGNTKETISSVLGRNKEANTLLILGIWLSNLLNKIEENHVEKAVKNNSYVS